MSPRVFIVDTNVVVAGLVAGSSLSPVARVLDAMLSGKLVYLLSPALLGEYRSALLRPKLAKLHGLTETQIDQFLVEITANAIWREPRQGSPAPERGDDHLWALLGPYRGSILIRGDRLLLENPPTQSLVIPPAAWPDDFFGGGGRDDCIASEADGPRYTPLAQQS